MYCKLLSEYDGKQAGDILDRSDDEVKTLVKLGIAEEQEIHGSDEEEKAEEDQDPAVEPEMASAMKAVDRKIKKANETLAETAARASLDAVRNYTKSKAKLGIPAEARGKIFNHPVEWVRAIAKCTPGLPQICTKSFNKLAEFHEARKKTSGYLFESGTGQYLVPQEWAPELFVPDEGTFDLFSMTNKHAMSGNTVNVAAVSTSTHALGAMWGGVVSYWMSNEGDAITPSKPTFANVQLVAKTSAMLVGQSKQLVDDNAYDLWGFLQRAFGNKRTFDRTTYLINGAGSSSQPYGLLNTSSRVAVAAESGQLSTSDQSLYLNANMSNMLARLGFGPNDPMRKRAIFIAHLDFEPVMSRMTLNSSGASSAYGIQYDVRKEMSPYTYNGVPIMFTECASAVGTEGDLILCDPKCIATIEKPFEVEFSTEFKFDTLEIVFRAVDRWDARNTYINAITPFHGSNTRSSVVTRATLHT